MLKPILISLVLVLTQTGCNQTGEHVWPYDTFTLPEEGRLDRERSKRQFLKIEELQVGTGPVAGLNRRILTDTEVRYLDGTVVYKGPILIYTGFFNYASNLTDSRLLGGSQPGIELGIDRMAVGGRRRFTVDEALVCEGVEESSSGRFCTLTTKTKKSYIVVRAQTLIVEATLIEACNPVVLWQGLYMFGGYMLKWTTCREEELPRLDPTAPIWHFYSE